MLLELQNSYTYLTLQQRTKVITETIYNTTNKESNVTKYLIFKRNREI